MRYFSVSIVLLILSGAFLYSGTNPEWRKVDSVPHYIDSTDGSTYTMSWYYKMNCADSMHCALIGGEHGEWIEFVRATSDGGETWKDIYRDSSIWDDKANIFYNAIFLTDIAYPSPDLIIAIGDSGKIMRSTDMGENWEEKNLGKMTQLKIIKMYNKEYGILRGVNTEIKQTVFYETNNGGIDWTKMNLPEELTDSVWFEDFHILSPGYLVFVMSNMCYNPRIMHVHGNWEKIEEYPQPAQTLGYRLMHIYFADEKRGWLLGADKPDKENPTVWDQNQVIYYTNDAGKNWTKQLDTLFFYGLALLDAGFYNDRFGIATSFYGYAFLTYNGGRTWELIHVDENPLGATFNVSSPNLTSYTSGFALVDLESVYKFTRDWSIPHDTTGSPDDSVKSFFPSPPPGENLLGAYPNPFSDRTRILYYLAAPSRATITIYDLQGNELETPLDDYAGEGFHEIEYINKGLAPGFYYYRLRAGGKVVTRKLLIING